MAKKKNSISPSTHVTEIPDDAAVTKFAAMEKFENAIAQLIGAREFDSVDELNKFLERARKKGKLDDLLAATPETPAGHAQELAWQAMDATTEREATSLVTKALKLDPDCVDALLLRAELKNGPLKQYIEDVRLAVLAGRKRLGPAGFRNLRGHFWGHLETRPFMRAKEALGCALIEANEYSLAALEFEEMLDWNPGDNQGVRAWLFPLYVAMSDWEGCASLAKRYEGDSLLPFVWSLHLYTRLAPDLKKRPDFQKALRRLIEQNPILAARLSGKRVKPPAGDEDGMEPGGPVEADYAWNALVPAMKAHPEAARAIAEEVKVLLASDR